MRGKIATSDDRIIRMTKPANIPPVDVSHQTAPLIDELKQAIGGVLETRQFVLGEDVAAFEQEIAAYLGTEHAVGLNSGTDALTLALHAMDIGPGDEVITSPFTFYGTVEPISLRGATPVFADIDPATFNLDVAAVREAITPRTRAILPVDLYGQGPDLYGLLQLARENNLYLIEDACQAIGGEFDGRKLGTLGDAGAFSFYPTKNLGCAGDGGLMVTPHAEVAERVRQLRNHAQISRGWHEELGYNSRLDGIQAAVLRVRLKHLDDWNTDRQRVAARYSELLADTPGITTPAVQPKSRHVFHQYTIRIADGRRDQVKERMAESGVGSMIYYPHPMHQLPMYRDQARSLPAAEKATDEVLSLPIWPGLEDERIAQVVESLKSALG